MQMECILPVVFFRKFWGPESRAETGPESPHLANRPSQTEIAWKSRAAWCVRYLNSGPDRHRCRESSRRRPRSGTSYRSRQSRSNFILKFSYVRSAPTSPGLVCSGLNSPGDRSRPPGPSGCSQLHIGLSLIFGPHIRNNLVHPGLRCFQCPVDLEDKKTWQPSRLSWVVARDHFSTYCTIDHLNNSTVIFGLLSKNWK